MVSISFAENISYKMSLNVQTPKHGILQNLD